jgi:hypothetical protein
MTLFGIAAFGRSDVSRYKERLRIFQHLCTATNHFIRLHDLCMRSVLCCSIEYVGRNQKDRIASSTQQVSHQHNTLGFTLARAASLHNTLRPTYEPIVISLLQFDEQIQ